MRTTLQRLGFAVLIWHGSSQLHAQDAALEVHAGGGVASRDVRLPAAAAERRIDVGWFPAVDLAFDLGLRASERVEVRIDVRYQTSLALSAGEESSVGSELRTSVRTHEAAVGVSPTYHFTNSADAVQLGVFAGWGFRGLRPVIELRVPAYSMSGPLARLELEIPLLRRRIALQFRPEAEWLMFVSEAIQNLGATAPVGWALGGEVALRVRLTKAMTLQAAYREVHAQLASHWAHDFTDVVRFVTLRAVLSY
jgi:hypothetical protein